MSRFLDRWAPWLFVATVAGLCVVLPIALLVLGVRP